MIGRMTLKYTNHFPLIKRPVPKPVEGPAIGQWWLSKQKNWLIMLTGTQVVALKAE